MTRYLTSEFVPCEEYRRRYSYVSHGRGRESRARKGDYVDDNCCVPSMNRFIAVEALREFAPLA
jgi:hypothetical protein